MGEGNCRDCKDWHGCVGKDWYSYPDIRWCPFQVMWLLKHADTLCWGDWPPEPGRADPGIGEKQVSKEGHFVKPKVIIAELKYRLDRCGVQGKLLAAQARARDDIDMLEPEAWQALMYVKGFKRKSSGFSDWKKKRNYRALTTSKYP